MSGLRLDLSVIWKRFVIVGGGGTTAALKFNVASNSQYVPVIGA